MRTTDVPDAPSWRRGGRRAQGLAALLLLLWLPLCGWLFWYFDGRYLSGAADQLARFDPLMLPAAPRSGVVNVLYLADSHCRCNRGLAAQMAAVQRRFGADVRQFIVGDGGPQRPTPSLESLDADQTSRWRSAVVQRPALVVWRADGALAYVGPLRAASGCGASGDAIAVIRRALDGFSLPLVAMDVAGCFCEAPARMAQAGVAPTFADNPS